jgi:hypothetical protein
MSTRKRVRRKLFEDGLSDVLGCEELSETGGVAFSDGHCVELVKDNSGSLALLSSRSKKFLPRVDLAGQNYVPPTLAMSIVEALTLPNKRTDCGSTVELFAQIRNFFLDCGFSDDAARTSTNFAFTSWFPEFLPVAPCLVINGREAEARVFLQLLGCIVRHALPLAEVNAAILAHLPMYLQPTLLIGHVSPATWRLFSASNHPGTYILSKNELIDLYCVKAAFAASTLGGVSGDSFLNINCNINGKRGPVIDIATQEKIAAEFQSKLLDYRLKNIAQVRDSDFDAPTLPTPLRMLARALGSCLVAAPELQADVVQLLESQGDALRADRLLDLKCVTIEAILGQCHGEDGPTRVGISEIATRATAILADRGENALVESKTMGTHLRFLGFRAKRDSKGFAIHLNTAVRQLTHRLARDLRVGESDQAVPGCPHCTELMTARIEKPNP